MIKFFAILFRQNIIFESLHSLPTQSLLLGNLDRVGFGLQKKNHCLLIKIKKKHSQLIGLTTNWVKMAKDQ